ncbi:immunoglobulin-like domain-containing protein [Pedobacter sp. D749]|uniref:immunoglobulin-like domain-containing protein n=1 Tax=Pedobacter sp. D749 TaxID=2856523 RepID=UPI001C56A9F5|nr:immunoglobulin-like domain-containing protein [Pedobacter sp. D749]QXU41421.1 DUF5011 domain-containing protein [Pedobacter sp. D749]
MKRYLIIIILGVISMTYSSCKKESFDYPEGYVGISKITVFPIITMKGDKYVAVAKGATYTDAGATAAAGTSNIEVKVTGLPNTATAGVYLITYSATNADGFSATTTRSVVVYDTKADALANDFSGDYLRAATGTITKWTKLAPGAYLVNNPGGAATGTSVNVIAINPTGSLIDIPQQNTDSGPWGSNTESKNLVSGNYSWAVENPGYGTAVRTFVKQ